MSKFEWGDEKSKESAFGGRKSTPKVSDHAEMANLTDGEWHTGRLIGPVFIHKLHWITIKPKPDFKGKYPTIPKICLAAHGTLKGERTCPYCDAFNPPSGSVFQNFLERDRQDEFPPKKLKPATKYEKNLRTINGYEGYFKERKGEGMQTPLALLNSNSSLGNLIGDTVALNKVKTDKGTRTFPPDHPKYGYDLMLKYDESKSASARWSVQKGERTRLTDEEQDYLLWKVDDPVAEPYETAVKECEQLVKKACKRDGTPLFPDKWEGDGVKSKKGKKNNQYSDSFDDEDEDEDYEDTKKKSGKKRRREDDDEDDDDDDRPSRKKSSNKKKSRAFDDDDDYEEDDDDDTDDEEDEDEDDRPSRKKSSKKRRREDEDEEEDDDDDRPRRSSNKNSKKSSKRRRRDDDDDDDVPF